MKCTSSRGSASVISIAVVVCVAFIRLKFKGTGSALSTTNRDVGKVLTGLSIATHVH